jgi:signal transduction histidine kinase
MAPGVDTVGNPDHLQRLFRNILENAVRYARRRVLITATTAADEIRIEIDDDGPGIPAADRGRVFDRFVRLDSSRERSTGTTGLGLAIAREIALAHHGRIDIADSPFAGARVIVSLPLAPSSAPTPQSRTGAQ